jgi:hypothetical protein
MGEREHGGGVNPETLLVWGVRGLSVDDASLMLITIGVHLTSTVKSVAEKVHFSFFVNMRCCLLCVSYGVTVSSN